MNSSVLVSFIISAYNEEKHVVECIDSCLSQTHSNIEIVLVNDGSSDATSETVKRNYGTEKRVHVLDLPENKGKVNGFNLA
ncbi:MAG: glycosyltransferase family 2 protein, partial [Proteobacteria bacterium]|nr:glycosyltransferase family 2 protein [Pseudomonadota bacterium]